MVALDTIRAHNSTLKSLAPGLVAVFVGGTSGIGLSTAREFVRNTQSPHVYLIGRNQNEASRITAELQGLNETSKVEFIKSDVSLLRSVDEACKQIKEKEQKVNLLFMTVGYITMKGRDETEEGLDRKFSLHYYARMRFADQLAPLLTAAANDANPNAQLSRVVSVLDPRIGNWGRPPFFEDLSLKHNFSLQMCGTHASTMNNFTNEHFAKNMPGTSYIHAYPSGVDTGIMRGLGRIMQTVVHSAAFLLRPFMVDITESGERHLFASTAPRFAPKSNSAGVEELAMGSDSVKGSGAYQLNWNGETVPENKKYSQLRSEGAEKKIWEHTQEVFQSICEGNGRY